MLVANKLFTIYFVNIISVGTMHQITVAVGVSPVLIVVQRKYSQPFPAAAVFNGLGYGSREFLHRVRKHKIG